MPALVYNPAIYPPVDGATTNASNLGQVLFNSAIAVPDSLEIINGRLDNTNRQAATVIGRDEIRPRAVSQAKMVGSTANVDYFFDWFQDKPAAATTPLTGQYLAVPGANITFRLNQITSVVMLTWSIFIATDCNHQDDDHVLVRLWVDGATVGEQRRQWRWAGVAGVGPPPPSTAYSSRQWAGHHLVQDMAQGWHTAGLRICLSGDVGGGEPTQARVRVRSMRYIAFL